MTGFNEPAGIATYASKGGGVGIVVICKDGSVWHKPALTSEKWHETTPLINTPKAASDDEAGK